MTVPATDPHEVSRIIAFILIFNINFNNRSTFSCKLGVGSERPKLIHVPAGREYSYLRLTDGRRKARCGRRHNFEEVTNEAADKCGMGSTNEIGADFCSDN